MAWLLGVASRLDWVYSARLGPDRELLALGWCATELSEGGINDSWSHTSLVASEPDAQTRLFCCERNRAELTRLPRRDGCRAQIRQHQPLVTCCGHMQGGHGVNPNLAVSAAALAASDLRCAIARSRTTAAASQQVPGPHGEPPGPPESPLAPPDLVPVDDPACRRYDSR